LSGKAVRVLWCTSERSAGVTRDELDEHDGWAESREGGNANLVLVGKLKGKRNKVRQLIALIVVIVIMKMNMSRLGLRDPFQIA